jgi:hypothetical protein
MAIVLIERNAHVCFKFKTRTAITWNASESESKKQYGNQRFHFSSCSGARDNTGPPTPGWFRHRGQDRAKDIQPLFKST